MTVNFKVYIVLTWQPGDCGLSLCKQPRVQRGYRSMHPSHSKLTVAPKLQPDTSQVNLWQVATIPDADLSLTGKQRRLKQNDLKRHSLSLWLSHPWQEGGGALVPLLLGFQFLVHCWKESRALTLSRCSLHMSTSSTLQLRSDPLIRGGGNLAVVNSRRRNLITPFTITSQPPRGLDNRLGNCGWRKCSLKLTWPGTGAESKETTKAFRRVQEHSTSNVPPWGQNLVAYRTHNHTHFQSFHK